MPHSHRSGQLKQRNKEHKTGRHRTKGQLDREFRGVYMNGCRDFITVILFNDDIFNMFQNLLIMRQTLV